MSTSEYKTDALKMGWSKCVFCGAHNGKFGAPMHQHNARCRFKGNADSFDVQIPNYYQFIEEDNQSFLPMMHEHHELPKIKKELAVLTERTTQIAYRCAAMVLKSLPKNTEGLASLLLAEDCKGSDCGEATHHPTFKLLKKLLKDDYGVSLDDFENEILPLVKDKIAEYNPPLSGKVIVPCQVCKAT